jgi:hypothetical protein
MTKASSSDFDKTYYPLEKLSQAVHELVTNAGRVQERLREAERFLIAVEPSEFSDDDLRRAWMKIKDCFTEAGTASEEDASDIAGRILALYERLSDVFSQRQAST